MNAFRTRSTLLVTAIAATLALGACGDGRNDSATTSRDGMVATNRADAPKAGTSSNYSSDRVTADASSATAGSDKSSMSARNDASGSNNAASRDVSGSKNAASRDVSGSNNAGDRAAGAAGDAAMTAKVKAALMAEPGIDSLQIDVDTSNGRVTLTGEVDNPQNRQRALQTARGVDGVSGVVDRMSVRR